MRQLGQLRYTCVYVADFQVVRSTVTFVGVNRSSYPSNNAGNARNVSNFSWHWCMYKATATYFIRHSIIDMF